MNDGGIVAPILLDARVLTFFVIRRRWLIPYLH